MDVITNKLFEKLPKRSQEAFSEAIKRVALCKIPFEIYMNHAGGGNIGGVKYKVNGKIFTINEG